ncbi:hypothetical protein ACTWJ8_39810 (plasmid) [Streptomyces sp. SDT5-1]|uniref:hypothetical protein n=1 Tax=Streptomyces sp. SDT5-1 TaxID=3406418 RepID=UPI003FD5D17F
MTAPRRTHLVRQCYACLAPITYVPGPPGVWLHLDEHGRIEGAGMWRGHLAEPKFVHGLQLGDRFRFFDGTGTVYGPVATVDTDYMCTDATIRLAGRAPLHRHAWSQVEVTQRGPRCACGRPYDRCEAECPWPDAIEELWASQY